MFAFAQLHHIGFLGVDGLVGVLIGLIIFIIIAVILWRVLMLVLPKLGLDATWCQVISLLCGLLLFLSFLHFCGIL